jgi:predicted GNAT family N-acyltransferase
MSISSRSQVVRIADWDTAGPLVMPLRLRVFVEEQGVPADIELDRFDAVSRHAIALDERGRVIGTGRLLPDGHVGRMAVESPLRRSGVGTRVLQALLEEAVRSGLTRVVLHAQLHVTGFYTRFGFCRQGEVFIEAGIPHILMARLLDSPTRCS